MSKVTQKVQLQLPEKFRCLLNVKARYKMFTGGRGSAKTESLCRAALILMASKQNYRILNCREIQKSISDSVYAVYVGLINDLDLRQYFAITDHSIKCPSTGSEMFFEGLFRNVDKIKSFYAADLAIVFEAAPVSEESWQLLLPTIRKPDSEIWGEWNPKYASDAVHQRFVVNKPDDCILQIVNWKDNPWFPKVLEAERANDYKFRPREARNIWEGELVGSGGLVFDFDETVHVRPFPKEKISVSGLYCALDPHSAHYSACVWIAHVPTGENRYTNYIIAEYPTFNTVGALYADIRKSMVYEGSYADLSREIYQTEYSLNITKMTRRFIDTRFASGTGSAMWSTKTEGIITEFSKKENGALLFTPPPVTSIDAQRSRVKQDLSYNQLIPVSSINEPHLFVDPSCRNVIHMFKNHRFEEYSEKETEQFKDFSDCIRICYAGMQTFKYTAPEPKSTDEDPFAAYEVAGWGGENAEHRTWMSN